MDAFEQLEELQATARHIGLLNSKIERLTSARAEAWEQMLAAVSRLYRTGQLDELGALDLYKQMRSSYGPGFSKVWDRSVPDALSGNRMRSIALRDRWNTLDHAYRERNQPNGPSGTWVGVIPIEWDHPAPVDGVSVVYVLYDHANEPAYVGSTQHFRTRVKAHLSEKDGLCRWMAYECKDREAAFRLEDRLLRERKPYMNQKASR